MASTAFGRHLADTGCMLLALATSRSVFQHSSRTSGLGLLAAIDIMGSFTWRTGAATLLNASVDDTTSIYFLATHGKTISYKFDSNIVDLLFFMKI
jgi:hypothetical protein